MVAKTIRTANAGLKMEHRKRSKQQVRLKDISVVSRKQARLAALIPSVTKLDLLPF